MALRPVFEQAAAAHGVPANYLEAIAWVESGWNEAAVSPAKAVGIGQILPTTAQEVNQAQKTNLAITAVNDNINLEASYVSYLNRTLGGNPCLVTAAYNEGPKNLLSVGVYYETQNYVYEVLGHRANFS